METITYQTINTSHPMFRNRGTTIYSGDSMDNMKFQSYSPVPDTVVLCNGCNENQYPGTVDAIYINNRLHDVYCHSCRQRYFPQAKPA